MAQSRAESCAKVSNFTPAERRRMAAEAGVDDIEGQVQHQKLIRRSGRTGKIIEDLRLAREWSKGQAWLRANGDTTANRKKVLSNVLVRSLRDDAGDVSIEATSHGINRLYQSNMAEIAEDIRPDRLGWRRKQELMDDLSAELHGRKTGNGKAAKAAQGISDMLEDIRLRFNRAGGKILKRSDWGMPHGSNARKMARVGMRGYINRTFPLLDRAKMTNAWGAPMSEPEIRELLSITYREIVGDGEAGGHMMATANKYQESRELHFRNYQEYSKQFGDENTWKVLTDHVERMSRELALMERLGNNPRQAFTRLAQQYGLEEDRNLNNLFTNLAGFQRPDHNVFTRYGSTVRPALSAAQLGSAILSSVADVATVSINAAFNGMQWGRMLSQLSASAEGRVFAARIGASIDWALDGVGISQRFDDVAGAGWSQRAADTVFRASGLSAWTNMLRRAHAMEFAQTLAEHSGKRMSDIEPRFRKMLESYGVDEAQWRAISGGTKLQYKGQKYLDMTSIKDEEAQLRIMAIMGQEQDLGIVMPDTRSRSFINQGFAEDTWQGQGLRSFGQYKQYPVSIVMNNFFRYLTSKRLDTGSRLGYTTALIVTTTVLGGLSVQLKEVAKGRDPRNMREAEFWNAAFLQGGGAGLLGDFFFGEENRYGQPLWASALGPTGGLLYDAGKVAGKALEGEADIATAGRYVPGQSLWYTRLLYQRYLIDQFSKLNPDYVRNKRSAERRRETQQGQKTWFPAGAPAPKRAPDLTQAVDKPRRGKAVSDWVPNID